MFFVSVPSSAASTLQYSKRMDRTLPLLNKGLCLPPRQTFKASGGLCRPHPPFPQNIKMHLIFVVPVFFILLKHKFLLNRRGGDLKSTRNKWQEVWSWADEDPAVRYNSLDSYMRGAIGLLFVTLCWYPSLFILDWNRNFRHTLELEFFKNKTVIHVIIFTYKRRSGSSK